MRLSMFYTFSLPIFALFRMGRTTAPAVILIVLFMLTLLPWGPSLDNGIEAIYHSSCMVFWCNLALLPVSGHLFFWIGVAWHSLLFLVATSLSLFPRVAKMVEDAKLKQTL